MALFGGSNSDLSIIIRATDKASPVFKKAEKNIKKTSDSLIKTGQRLTLGLTAPIALFGALMIKAASRAEETQAKFDVVFKGIERSTNAWAENFARDVGRSRNEIKMFSSGIADVLKPMGLQTQAAADMSKKMVELALDVASFNNRQDADVIRAFTSALTGERESLKTLGIVITEADVKQEAYAAGLAKVGQELSKEAKAQATINLLFKNSEDAQGDLIRTGDSFANQTKTLTGRLDDLAVTLGEELLPTATKVVTVISNLIGMFEGMNEAQRGVTIRTLALLAAIGPATFVVGQLTKAFLAARAAMIGATFAAITLRTAISFLVPGLGLLFLAFSALQFVMSGTSKETSELQKLIDEEADSADEATEATDSLAEAFGNLGDTAKGVSKDIEKLEQEITKTIKANADKQQTFKENLAQAFIDQEEKVRDLREDLDDQELANRQAVGSKELEMRREQDRTKRLILRQELANLIVSKGQETQALRDQLREEEMALNNQRSFRADIQAELIEMQRRANLTDFELQVENLLRKRIADLQSFAEKLALQVQEIVALKAQHSAIQSAEADHTKKLKEELSIRVSNEQSAALSIIQARQSVISSGSTRAVSGNPLGLRLPSKEHGGIVNAPRGRAVPIIAHGQERIIPANQSRGGGASINITINNPSFQDRGDIDIFREQIEKALRDVVRVYKLDIS